MEEIIKEQIETIHKLSGHIESLLNELDDEDVLIGFAEERDIKKDIFDAKMRINYIELNVLNK